MIVYTYTCNDGVTRTRCAQHVAEHGPYAPHRTKSMTVKSEGACVACGYGGGLGWKVLRGWVGPIKDEGVLEDGKDGDGEEGEK